MAAILFAPALPLSSTARVSPPQYLLFTDCAPNGLPTPANATANAKALQRVTAALGGLSASPDGSVLVGCELIFSLLNAPLPELEAALNATLAAAELAGVPVSLIFDGQNYWSASGLWNWWNASLPGYDRANANNVEWTRPNDPTSAVKLGWRNWGRQSRVTPEQNVLAPAVKAALQPLLFRMSSIVAAWYGAASDQNKRLLATVKVGWEAGLQYNAYFYPNGNELVNAPAAADPTTGLDWRNTRNALGAGLPVLGYAAAASARLKIDRALTGAQAATLTSQYVGWLAEIVHSAGVPAELISNHVGGQVPPWKAVPFSAAFADLGVPGFSMYWGSPQGNASPLGAEMAAANRTRWAAAEWREQHVSADAWRDNLNATLGFLDCTHLSVYDNGFSAEPEAVAGVRAFLLSRNS